MSTLTEISSFLQQGRKPKVEALVNQALEEGIEMCIRDSHGIVQIAQHDNIENGRNQIECSAEIKIVIFQKNQRTKIPRRAFQK